MAVQNSEPEMARLHGFIFGGGARLRKHLAAGQAGEVEGRLRRFDGEYRGFLCRFAPSQAETGSIVNWHRTATDIDDRKRAEALLKGEKQLLEMVASGRPLEAVMD